MYLKIIIKNIFPDVNIKIIDAIIIKVLNLKSKRWVLNFPYQELIYTNNNI